MRVAVTGATGFLGSNLVRLLLTGGHEVRILRRQKSHLRLLAGLAYEEHVGDIRDAASLAGAFNGCDAVFHTAASVAVFGAARDRQQRTNVDGTRNVLDACLAQGVGRFIYTSSIAAVGLPPEGVIADETLPFNWAGYGMSYMETKHEAEEQVLSYAQRGLPAVILNPANIFGPGDIHMHLGGLLMAVQAGHVPAVPSGGFAVCHVTDVAQAHIAAAERGRVGERYILGGENLSFREIATTVAEVVGARPPRWTIPDFVLPAAGLALEGVAALSRKPSLLTRKSATVGGRHLYFSSAKAERELGYAITPFRESVREMYEWYLANGMMKTADSGRRAMSV
ncbi:MAG: SDR family oxidoreductase [Symbiobacteriia bacterium]